MPPNAATSLFWVVIALVIVQLGFSGSNIVIKLTIKDAGINPLVFATLRDVCAFPVLLLVAASIEGFRFPEIEDLPTIFLLGLTGGFGNQFLFIIGLYLTAPTIAAIFQPTVPIITTIMAVASGVETLEFKSKKGRAKVVGIISATLGAIVIILSHQKKEGNAEVEGGSQFDFMLGVLCLLSGCASTSAYMLLQKKYIFDAQRGHQHSHHHLRNSEEGEEEGRHDGSVGGGRYPPLHVAAWMYGSASVMMTLCSTYYVATGKYEVFALPSTVWWPLLYVVLVTSTACYGLLSWANKHSSPTIVTAFWPLQVPCVAFLSYFLFGDTILLSDIVGAFFITIGLLCVTYAHAPKPKRTISS